MSLSNFEVRSFVPHPRSPYTKQSFNIYNSNLNLAPYDWSTFLNHISGGQGFIALQRDERAIGAAILVPREEEWATEVGLNPSETAYLCILAAANHLKHTNRRSGSGIGTALIQQVHARAQRWGKAGILLASSGEAEPFYGMRGYEVCKPGGDPLYMYRELTVADAQTSARPVDRVAYGETSKEQVGAYTR